MSANIILQARNLKKYYGKGETQVHEIGRASCRERV